MQKNTLKLFWNYSKPYALQRFLVILFPTLAVLAGAFAGPLILSHILNLIQEGSATVASTLPIIAWYLVTQLFGEVVFWRFALYFT